MRGSILLTALAVAAALPAFCQAPEALELTRPVRSWEFASSVGQQAALLGKEDGTLEAWVYPLKIVRDFHLVFRTDGHDLPAEALARTLVVRPESTSIVYAWDTFTVTETLFSPVHEQGAIVRLKVQATHPVEILAVFRRDLQFEWPAALPPADLDWSPALHAFAFASEQKYYALLGSASAASAKSEFTTNYASADENVLDLGVIAPGNETRDVVIAASMNGRTQAEATYKRLTANASALMKDAANYYDKALRDEVQLRLPDKRLEQAYNWAQVAMLQGLVDNPMLGTGLIAGYNQSGEDGRPGFDWFFGRDALWTSLALNASGNTATTRTALEFLARYQRADGKITHEIAQTATLVPWFHDLPYAYAAADATPLFVIAMEDYVRHSGDVDFAREHWDNLAHAYSFLRSTYDDHGLPRNGEIGHGWVEGGPLLPVKNELYQSALGLEAIRSLARLSTAVGKDSDARELSAAFEQQKRLVNGAFWIEGKKRFAFALDGNHAQVDTPSVLATVPMWFGLLDEEKGGPMLSELATPSHRADWGMRILSSENRYFDPGGYHFGSVWPLFTGWASVGEYRYHRPYDAYANLRANALLTFDGSLGHVTEVLSGSFNQPLSTASPQQVWSSAMVTSPLLLGMFGLDGDSLAHRVTLRPHTPASWKTWAIDQVPCGNSKLGFSFLRGAKTVSLTIRTLQGPGCEVVFSPALSLRAKVLSARLNGRPVAAKTEANVEDQHVSVRIAASTRESHLVMHISNDVEIGYDAELPALGSGSEGLHLLSQAWSASRNSLTLRVSGRGGHSYALDISNPSQVRAVDGAALLAGRDGLPRIVFTLPDAAGAFTEAAIMLHFVPR